MRSPSEIFRIATQTSALVMTALLSATLSLAAQTIKDPTFGFSVTPPSGYAGMLLTPMPSRRVLIAVQRVQPNDAGCLIEFELDDSNGGWSQAYFNNRADKSEWIEKVRAEVAVRYDIHNITPIEHDGVRGTAITGDKQYDRPKNVNHMAKPTREWYVVLDTVKGRTTIECTAPRLEFEARQVEFEAVLRTIALPK
jgi:hypothetical protein